MGTNAMSFFFVTYRNCFLFLADVKEAMIHKISNYLILRSLHFMFIFSNLQLS